MLIAKLLDPKIDYVFKRIFGHAGNEEITEGFLSAILEREVSNVVLDCNPILEKDLLNEKISILDIKAKIEKNINCNIEMQVIDRKNVEKRILYHWSKMYSSGIKKGQDYNLLNKNIVILISNYELEHLKEIKKYLTKWYIMEKDYTDIILTDVFEVCIIELPKFKRYVECKDSERLDSWINFIKNPEVSMKEEEKALKKAREVLEEISQDERERRLAELREITIMDHKAIEEAGYDKGLEKGIEQGKKQGSQKEKISIAKKMKEEKIDIDLIVKITGLTIEEIEKLD